MSDRPRGWNSTLPQRTEPLRPTGKVKPATRKRREARKSREFARKYHSIERVTFIKHALQCEVPGCGRFPCENAHLGNEGLGRKSSFLRVVPLCWLHHCGLKTSLDKTSQVAFEHEYGIDLDQLAEWTEARWQQDGARWVAERKADGSWERLVA